MTPTELAECLAHESDDAITVETVDHEERVYYVKSPDDDPIRIDVTGLIETCAYKDIEREAVWQMLHHLLESECRHCDGDGVRDSTHSDSAGVCNICDGTGKVNEYV